MSVAHSASVAAVLIDEFGSLRRVINANAARLRRVADEKTCASIRFYRQAALEALQPEPGRAVLTRTSALEPYLIFDLADRGEEEFRVFYVDAACRLIREETVANGTVDECTTYVRRILGRALELGAAGLIVVHNHPSGNATPSDADYRITSKLGKIAAGLEIRLYEHLIVTSSGTFSWRKAGLL